jgi:hypothetical protein
MRRLYALLGLTVALAAVIIGPGSAATAKPRGTELASFSPGAIVNAESAGTVNAAPTGPKAPEGGWSVEFADAFAKPVGAGGDTFWKANENKQGCCDNSDEIGTEKPYEVKRGPEGLEIQCEYVSTEVNNKHYVCGGIDTYDGFAFKPGGGQTWAFEVDAKVPPRNWGEDPGWWASDIPWTAEIDWFEFWENEHEEYYAGDPVWIGKTNTTQDTVNHESYRMKTEVPNPETGFHRYTTVLKPNNEMEEYVDGVYKWSVKPPPAFNTPWMHLILTHALRVSTKLTGVSSFDIRSVAVYEDTRNAGQNVEHGGIAPGTTIAGEPSKEEPPKEEHKEPPREEPPKEEHKEAPKEEPPVESVPHIPTNLAAVSEGTWVRITYKANSAEDHVTEYRLYRTGRNHPGLAPNAPFATNPASSLSFSDSYELEPHEWTCYRLAAVNAKGESQKTGPECTLL